MRKLFVLIGDPVAHSRSPAIHARAFALLGVDAAYAPCRVSPQDLEQAVDGLRALGADGFNVPVQDEAIPFDVALLTPGAALADLVYTGTSGETPLVRAARQRGLAAVDGIDVLVHQAIASLEIWLSRPGLGHLAPALREAALA